MVTLDSLVSTVISNARRVSTLKRFGIVTLEDALTYYPFRVTDPVPQGTLREATVGEPLAFHARVLSVQAIPMHGRAGSRVEITVDDSEFAQYGSVAQLTFFSHKRQYVAWMLSRFSRGDELVVCGSPTVFNNTLQFTHPEIEVIGTDLPTAAAALEKVTRPRPVYHATARFSSERLHESVMVVLEALETAGSEAVPSLIPQEIREQRGLLTRLEAFHAIHAPTSVAEFHHGIATMRAEEAFISQVSLLQTRRATQQTEAFACPDTTDDSRSLTARLRAGLPFTLTPGQAAVSADIASDLARDFPMQRLLQGEVGSGKTVVALLAMLQVLDSGYQAVLVAPTQVLAEQHLRTLTEECAVLGDDIPPIYLLTSSLKLHERRATLAAVASGEPCIVVATHAAFSKSFQVPRLALAIIDEQHRFGVEQRDALTEKSEKSPHLLVMTATPIPRTAAMTWFGDLELSELHGLPGGRKPVSTFVIPEADTRLMATMLWHLRKRIDAGERAYVVCPAIETAETAVSAGTGTGVSAGAAAAGDDDPDYVDFFEADGSSESSDEAEPKPPLHSVQEISARFAALPQFAGLHVATLTGRDDEETKTQVMAEFADGTASLLVSTTVIEVGVDVAAASCIVIFDADRFGLSQLHQLRGRVGRGGTDGWAFLVSRADPDSVAAERLEVIRTSTDGAEIAKADLSLRGVGDVLGDAQSGGKSSLKLLRVVKDADIITAARSDAEAVLAADPDLSSEPELAGAVLDFMRGKEKFLMRT